MLLLLAKITLSDLLLPFLMLIVIFIFVRRSRRRFRRSRDDSTIVHVARPESDRSGSARTSDELIRQEVEFHERSRDMSGMIDSKIRVLQQLITQSQQQIERLEALLMKSEDPAAGTSSPTAESASSPIVAKPVVPISTPTTPDDPQLAEIPHLSEILALADEGFSIATIAHRVGLPLQDVESILRERADT